MLSQIHTIYHDIALFLSSKERRISARYINKELEGRPVDSKYACSGIGVGHRHRNGPKIQICQMALLAPFDQSSLTYYTKLDCIAFLYFLQDFL